MSFYWYLLMTLMSTLEKYKKKPHILSTLFADTETHVKNTDY